MSKQTLPKKRARAYTPRSNDYKPHEIELIREAINDQTQKSSEKIKTLAGLLGRTYKAVENQYYLQRKQAQAPIEETPTPPQTPQTAPAHPRTMLDISEDWIAAQRAVHAVYEELKERADNYRRKYIKLKAENEHLQSENERLQQEQREFAQLIERARQLATTTDQPTAATRPTFKQNGDGTLERIK